MDYVGFRNDGQHQMLEVTMESTRWEDGMNRQ